MNYSIPFLFYLIINLPIVAFYDVMFGCLEQNN